MRVKCYLLKTEKKQGPKGWPYNQFKQVGIRGSCDNSDGAETQAVSVAEHIH